MNPPYMQGGPPQGQPHAIPHQSRRHQEYLQYQQNGPPRSPGPHNPYAAYPYPPQYYTLPSQMPYGMPRWQPHQQQYAPYHMMQQPQYPPRSPLVVSSQPFSPNVTNNTRPPPFSHVPFSPQSPHPAPPTPSASIPQSVPSSHGPRSHTSTPQPPSRRSSATTPAAPTPTTRMPFYPELPWYSPPEARHSFPGKARRRRKRRQTLHEASDAVALPAKLSSQEAETPVTETVEGINGTVPAASSSEAVSGTDIPDAPNASAPVAQEVQAESPTTVPGAAHARKQTKTALPIIPIVPQVSRQKSATAPQDSTADKTEDLSAVAAAATVAATEPAKEDAVAAQTDSVSSPPPQKVVPKSWADLVRSKNAKATQGPSMNGSALTNGNAQSLSGTMAEVLSQFNVDQSVEKIQFLEPRGLVNTGNMCYMNSILQILVFCIPFYDFLDQIGKRAAHSFKSDTPLVDAMIMFMREYKIIDSAESAEKLRMRLKDGELEKYGDPFIPEYVYDVIKRLPRFSSMRRGHQQDAEEFLGFLLEGLHDECVSAMRSQGVSTKEAAVFDGQTSPISATSQSADAGWLEVGPKQKAAVTRQSGDATTSSPITRIFGGALRSELRVPGLKNSVTLEPYQPLQLDIGAPNVNNITDALKGLTKPESLTGDFNSPRGPGTTATKQVFIETLPPMLILHLKRFQYDSSGGTQKIWKRVGYPLELEIPKEVCPPSKRGGLAVKGGLPRYRLNAVVYHHGKSAAGGHYTADILRQDRREWIRVDDTFIRRVRPEDVAEGGAEEDPKVLARALEQHKADTESAKRNLFEGLDGDDDKTDDGKSWKEVNGVEAGKKKWAGIAAASTGTATPTTAGKQTPRRENVKDNKVAYILLYEKISP